MSIPNGPSDIGPRPPWWFWPLVPFAFIWGLIASAIADARDR